jgi:hypothetical protein
LHSRSVFLHKLVVNKTDLNAIVSDEYYCPPWIQSSGSSCQLPSDIKLFKEYLTLGADPYFMYGDSQQETAIGLALNQCSPSSVDNDLLALMLAHPPKVHNATSQRGLDRSLNAVFGSFCRKSARLDVADRLIAYGANVNALSDLGATNLGTTMYHKDDEVYSAAAAYLLAHGARIDQPDSHGNTAMHWLLNNENPRMDRVLWLAQHGARLENVLNRPVLPISLTGPDKEAIIASIKANSK